MKKGQKWKKKRNLKRKEKKRIWPKNNNEITRNQYQNSKIFQLLRGAHLPQTPPPGNSCILPPLVVNRACYAPVIGARTFS